MKPTTRTVLPALATLAVLAGCSAPELDLMPRYQRLELSGGVGVDTTGVVARADAEAMGLGSKADVWGARADFKWGAPHLVVMGQSSSHAGAGILTADLTQGGNTITATTPVDSSVDFGVFSGVLMFDLLPTKMFELGIGLGAALLDLDARIQEQIGANVIAIDERTPVPLLAVDAGINIGIFEVQGLIQGIQVDYGDDTGRYIDADLFARVKFWDRALRFSIAVGWRQIMLDVDYQDAIGTNVEVDLELKGPYIGLEVTL